MQLTKRRPLGPTNELAVPQLNPELSLLKTKYYNKIAAVLDEATLQIPKVEYFQKGGKNGIHSEYMGYILTEMQFMQRTYPNMVW